MGEKEEAESKRLSLSEVTQKCSAYRGHDTVEPGNKGVENAADVSQRASNEKVQRHKGSNQRQISLGVSTGRQQPREHTTQGYQTTKKLDR